MLEICLRILFTLKSKMYANVENSYHLVFEFTSHPDRMYPVTTPSVVID